eukprot:1593270-Prymnesium_polylepis.1
MPNTPRNSRTVAFVPRALLVEDVRVNEASVTVGTDLEVVVLSAPSLAQLCDEFTRSLRRPEAGGWQHIRLIPGSLPVYQPNELPTLVRAREVVDD